MSNSPKLLARAIQAALATALFSQAALAAPSMLRLEAGPVDQMVIIAKDDGTDVYVDSRQQHTHVQIGNYEWAKNTYLPRTAHLVPQSLLREHLSGAPMSSLRMAKVLPLR